MVGGGVHRKYFPKTNCWGKTMGGFMANPDGTQSLWLLWENPWYGKGHGGIHGKTHGTQIVWLPWENPWYGKGHGGIHGKTHGAKFLNFDHGGQHHGNSWRVPNSKFWSFFHHICWIQLNKFADIKERVVISRCHVQILLQIYQKTWNFEKKVKLNLNLSWVCSLFKRILVWWGKCDPIKKIEKENLIFDDGQSLKPYLGL